MTKSPLLLPKVDTIPSPGIIFILKTLKILVIIELKSNTEKADNTRRSLPKKLMTRLAHLDSTGDQATKSINMS